MAYPLCQSKDVITVTLDTDVFPADELMDLARGLNFSFARVTVTDRETSGTSFESQLIGLEQLLEPAVWGESNWGEAVWTEEGSRLEEILQVISNRSFPRNRASLSKGHLHQLRDAMILDAHVRENRDIFVSNDSTAFMNEGRRELLQKRLQTVILTKEEFEAQLRGDTG